MLRRLYFILPSPAAVATTVSELQQAGIERRHLQAACRDPAPLRTLGIALKTDVADRGARLERLGWTLNLILFALALLAALGLLLTTGPGLLLAVPLLVMAASFLAGLRFTHVPNVHLESFRAALQHDELVLMVDVPRERVAEIESLVQRRHPEAVIGGVGWTSELLRT